MAQVLTFDAYYKTAVFASFGRINYNVRKLKIIYFLVDDTIQVNEPTEHNSGMPQGIPNLVFDRVELKP